MSPICLHDWLVIQWELEPAPLNYSFVGRHCLGFHECQAEEEREAGPEEGCINSAGPKVTLENGESGWDWVLQMLQSLQSQNGLEI